MIINKLRSRINGIMDEISKEIEKKKTRNSNDICRKSTLINSNVGISNLERNKTPSSSRKSIRNNSESSQSYNPLSIDGEIKKKIIRRRKNGFSSPYSFHILITFMFCLIEFSTFCSVLSPYMISEFPLVVGIILIAAISTTYMVIFALILISMSRDPTDPLSMETKCR
ncbi:unnamed protein product [Moneuplotes crassus]|uniref:Uncharacterized protein n=1 Tax=Euplotes crassus TaxID=5936 RepID=A0AAD1X3T8_EUPCR|nr:unnamed protein product [Moneuplotes crassus]